MQFDCIRLLKTCFVLYTLHYMQQERCSKTLVLSKLIQYLLIQFPGSGKRIVIILWRLWHLTEYSSNFKSNIHFLSCPGLFTREFTKIFDNANGFLLRLRSIFEKKLDLKPGINSKR